MAEERKRPLVRIKDMQALLHEELKRDMTQDQRNEILMKLVDLELAAQKRHQRRRGATGPRKKMGRPRKKYDSAGEPLYNDVPARPKPEDPEPTDLKSKFLSTLTSNESAPTEETQR